MAIYNSSYYTANTAVKAFLTKIGAKYWGKAFNTGPGNGKAIWFEIKDRIFQGKCYYCGKQSGKLQIEYLIMFNKQEYGPHHPGNIVSVCSQCNKRGKNNQGKYLDWENHLRLICEKNNNMNRFEERRQKILNHIDLGKFAYPKLSENEKHSIRVIAESLYNNITTETDNSLNLYEKITEAFVNTSD